MANIQSTPKTGETNKNTDPDQLHSKSYGVGLHLGGLTEAAKTPEHPRHTEAVELITNFVEALGFGRFDSGWVEDYFYTTLQTWRKAPRTEAQ